jgi:hypothetical protein
MERVAVTFEKVLHVRRVAPSHAAARHTVFSFITNGRIVQDVPAPGWPRLASGSRVMAVLREQDDWQSLVGWVNLETGEVVAPSPGRSLLQAAAALAVFLFFVFAVWGALGPRLPLDGLLLLALGLLLQPYIISSYVQWRRQRLEAREVAHLKVQTEA